MDDTSNYKEEFVQRRKNFLTKEYKSSFRQILSYLLRYRKLFTTSLILGIIQSLLFLTLPLFLGPVVDIITNPAADLGLLGPIFLLLFSLQLITGCIFGVRIYMNRWIGANIIYHLRNDYFSTIQIMSFGWLDQNKTGDLISRGIGDINLLKEFMANSLQYFIRSSVTFVLSFAVLFFINFELALYVLIISPALLFVLIVFRNKMRPAFKKSRETYSDLTHDIQEAIMGVRVIRSFGRQEYEVKDFKVVNDKYFNDSMGIIKLQAVFDPIIYSIDNISFLIVILLGGVFVLNGQMTFGEIFAFIMVMNFSIEPLYFMSRFIGNMPQLTETCDRIGYVLNSDVLVKEKPDAIELPPTKGQVEFENMSFSFDHSKEKDGRFVLKNINLKVKPGENIAILGATGSGKSALVKLLPRFYDVSKGSIKIDGIDIRDVTFKSLRKQIGYVSQDRLLFSRSISENISFGKRDLPVEEIERSAIASHINDFVESLPEKFNTKVGERGQTVSGGQKQRLTIARAIAINPKILILDDCFSAVDVDTEYAIQKRFKEIFEGTTVFFITQRLSTVRHADRIIVLDKGKMVQVGPHESLIEDTNGIYYKLLSTLPEKDNL